MIDLSALFQPLVDVIGITGLWLSFKKEQKKEHAKTRQMVYAIAKHLGLRIDDGIHIEVRTPNTGSNILKTFALFIAGTVLAVYLCSCSTRWINAADNAAKGGAAGATFGSTFGPYGTLIGGALGSILAATGVYKVGHNRGRKRERNDRAGKSTNTIASVV